MAGSWQSVQWDALELTSSAFLLWHCQSKEIEGSEASLEGGDELRTRKSESLTVSKTLFSLYAALCTSVVEKQNILHHSYADLTIHLNLSMNFAKY